MLADGYRNESIGEGKQGCGARRVRYNLAAAEEPDPGRTAGNLEDVPTAEHAVRLCDGRASLEGWPGRRDDLL